MEMSKLKALIKEVLGEEEQKLSDENIETTKFLLFLEEYSATCERHGVMINTDILLQNPEVPPILLFNKKNIKAFVHEMTFLAHGKDI